MVGRLWAKQRLCEALVDCARPRRGGLVARCSTELPAPDCRASFRGSPRPECTAGVCPSQNYCESAWGQSAATVLPLVEAVPDHCALTENATQSAPSLLRISASGLQGMRKRVPSDHTCPTPTTPAAPIRPGDAGIEVVIGLICYRWQYGCVASF